MQDKIMSMIGLATRAGKIKSGAFAAEKAIRDHSAELVLISKDASDNTKKHFKDMCSYRNIPLYEFGTQNELGKHTGNESRVVAAFTDEGFARKTEALIREVEGFENL